MHHPDAVACWRNRQAELEFHIRRHEWFLDKSVVLNTDALQGKIDAYRTEWNTYERLIRKVCAPHPAGRNAKSSAA
jgi:hypothetical protein